MVETMSRARISDPEGQPAADILSLVGARMTRDTAIYVAGTALVFPFSLISVAVLTRYLSPHEYGRLALMYVFAGFLTTAYNIGTLHGTFYWVYGSSAEGAEDAGAQLAIGEPVGVPQRALGTGVVLTLVVVAVGTAAVWSLSPMLARWLLHDGAAAHSVRWAGLSAATGSLWRLSVNLFRMERRAISFALLNGSRPLLVLIGATALVASGHGVDGALAGTALGTLAGVLVCVLVGHKSYAFAFNANDARKIIILGWRVVAPVLALWAVHNTDVMLLSRFASDSTVGIYRLAERVAVVPSYFASAFLMAWSPLERSTLFAAAHAERGRARVRSALLAYYLIAGVSLIVGMGLSADLLVQIAAPSYRAAARLIPVVACGFVMYGLFIVLVRAARLSAQMLQYTVGATLSLVVYGVMAVLLIPPMGSYGPAVATIGAMGVGCTYIIVQIQRSSERVSFQASRIAKLLIVAGGCYGVSEAASHEWTAIRPVALVAGLVMYPVLLIALRVVPRERVRLLLGSAGSFTRRRRRRRLVKLIAGLPDVERSALVAVCRDRLSVRTACETLGLAPASVASSLARGVCVLADLPPGCLGLHASEVGAYLASTGPRAEADALAARLIRDGVAAITLHQLEATVADLCIAKKRDWPDVDGMVRSEQMQALVPLSSPATDPTADPV
jgi:O-antigen/teichoic acid export membrane protein